jgi:acyl carrier protein
MTNEETLKQVMATVLGVPVAAISESTSMDTVESWDSIKHMNLVLALE